MRIAHISDLHILHLEGIRPWRFIGKRLTGGANLLLRRRKEHSADAVRRALEQIKADGADHIVVTGDLRQRVGAPLRAGETLFELSPDDAFRLDITVSEQDISLVEVGQTGRILLADGGADPLFFVVEAIRATAETRDGQNGFVVGARLTSTTAGLRPGLEGLARIDVGRGAAGAVWTRGLRNWARLFAWRWLP